MESKEKITRLMSAGFTLDEALEIITRDTVSIADPEPTPAAVPEPTPAAVPEQTPAAVPEESAEVKAIRELSGRITEMINVTRETARLYGVDGRSTGESAEDILANLG